MPALSKEWKLSAVQQKFSLPEALAFYIAQNPLSPKLYNKLIKLCKYFWLNNPIITLNCLDCYPQYELGDWHAGGVNGFRNKSQMKMENVNEKLWICEALFVNGGQSESLASSIIPKIYRCDLTYMDLSSQMITFADFKLLVSSGSLFDLTLGQTIVKNADGSIVPIEKLIELLPNLRSFSYLNVSDDEGLQTITSETAANLVVVPHFPQIESFKIYGVPESFDIDAFFETPKVSNLNSACFQSIITNLIGF